MTVPLGGVAGVRGDRRADRARLPSAVPRALALQSRRSASHRTSSTTPRSCACWRSASSVPITTLSDWRRETCGDLTSAFDFAAVADPNRPRLPNPIPGELSALIEGNIDIIRGMSDPAAPTRSHRTPCPSNPALRSAAPQWAATRLRWTG